MCPQKERKKESGCVEIEMGTQTSVTSVTSETSETSETNDIIYTSEISVLSDK
jgi:hypothetical protein